MTTRLFVPPHAGHTLDLPPEQVYFLEVTPFLGVFHYELDQSSLYCKLDSLNRLGLIPCVALLPAVHRGGLFAQLFGDTGNPKALPVQQSGKASRVKLFSEFSHGVHAARVATKPPSSPPLML